tara:strand:- start:125 stop:952 length:828 start_codon:yes stop_codon:yes gene_type:complete
MTKLSMFCLTLNPNHLNLIKNLGYKPVGLGNSNFSNDWLTDKNQNTIHHKNRFYGEYTFHYTLWKNNFLNFEGWIGFCQYRKFWVTNQKVNENISLETFKSLVLKEVPEKFLNYESIIGEELFVNKFRFSKFVKRNIKKMMLNPSLFFEKSKRTIKFHFDMMHGDGNLEKAIELLDKSEKNDFTNFVNTEVSFNPHNMFICKNKKILIAYYDSLFPWLERCEKIFGFESLEGYGLKRIYGFLAERYMSYWFKKYTKFAVLPIYFKDIEEFSYKNL